MKYLRLDLMSVRVTSYSRQDLEVDGVLQLASISHQLRHLFLANELHDDFGEVLTEDGGLLVAEDGPEVLDEGIGEEKEALADAILEVDVEVILPDALTVLAELLLDVCRQFS